MQNAGGLMSKFKDLWEYAFKKSGSLNLELINRIRRLKYDIFNKKLPRNSF